VVGVTVGGVPILVGFDNDVLLIVDPAPMKLVLVTKSCVLLVVVALLPIPDEKEKEEDGCQANTPIVVAMIVVNNTTTRADTDADALPKNRCDDNTVMMIMYICELFVFFISFLF